MLRFQSQGEGLSRNHRPFFGYPGHGSVMSRCRICVDCSAPFHQIVVRSGWNISGTHHAPSPTDLWEMQNENEICGLFLHGLPGDDDLRSRCECRRLRERAVSGRLRWRTRWRRGRPTSLRREEGGLCPPQGLSTIVRRSIFRCGWFEKTDSVGDKLTVGE